MSEVQLVIKDGYLADMNPGEAIEYWSGGVLKLMWVCPKCSKPTTTAKGHNHKYDKRTGSLHPSIVHNKKLGGCGYHGWLKNGVFKEI